MSLRTGTHVRSLRMHAEIAEAVKEGARRMGLAENQFIVQAIRFTCKQSGIPIAAEARELEDPFE